jgi:hypothetical protein
MARREEERLAREARNLERAQKKERMRSREMRQRYAQDEPTAEGD